eukprot:PITA_20203
MDFITGLPMVQGRGCIYVVVNRLTKYAHFFSIPSQYSTSQVAELFLREVFRLHGLPKAIVSDKDNCFMGAFWQELFKLVGTKFTPSTSYHLQTNGHTEIVNKWLEGYLRNYVTGQHVIRQIVEMAYVLELPPESKVHNVFHVSCLKKVLGQCVITATELPPLDDEGNSVLKLEAILETRERKLRSRIMGEYLMRWKNLPDEDATWEGEHILQHLAL